MAVDDQFSAMIPKREVYGRMQNGQKIEARVTAVKADGKLDLSVRGKIPQQMDKDAQLLLERDGEERRKPAVYRQGVAGADPPGIRYEQGSVQESGRAASESKIRSRSGSQRSAGDKNLAISIK